MGLQRIHRLIKLITLLQDHQGISAEKIAQDLGISRRTLFRDLHLLDEGGITHQYDRKSGYTISPGFFLPPVNLKISEALGLMILAEHAKAQPKQPLTLPAIEAVQKLIATMPDGIRTVCRDMIDNVSVKTRGIEKVDRDDEYYPIIQQAIDDHHVIRITYDSIYDREFITTLVHPFHLLCGQRAWYMIARSLKHSETRMFKLARIREIKTTQNNFILDSPFDINKYLGKAWFMIREGTIYDIDLHFTQKVARNVTEVKWHSTQQHTMQPDGSCIVTFQVDGLNEISWWLLGYGDQVVVRKPEALREILIKTYESALKRNKRPELEIHIQTNAADRAAAKRKERS